MILRYVSVIAVLSCCCPLQAQYRLYSSVDFLAVTRSNSSDNVYQRFQVEEVDATGIGLGTFVVSDEAAISSGDLDLDFVTAGRVTIGRQADDFAFESSYVRSDEWHRSAAISDGSGMLASPFSQIGAPPDPLYDNNTTASVAYQTELQMGEFAYLRRIAAEGFGEGWFSFGLRLMEIDELLTYATSNAVADNALVVSTDNQMIGPQVGFKTCASAWNGSFHFACNGALLYNDAEALTVFNGIVGRGDEGAASLLGELRLEYRFFATQHLGVRIGYQVIGLSDVALATDNFQTGIGVLQSGQAHVETRNVWYQLPYVGLSFAF